MALCDKTCRRSRMTLRVATKRDGDWMHMQRSSLIAARERKYTPMRGAAAPCIRFDVLRALSIEREDWNSLRSGGSVYHRLW